MCSSDNKNGLSVNIDTYFGAGPDAWKTYRNYTRQQPEEKTIAHGLENKRRNRSLGTLTYDSLHGFFVGIDKLYSTQVTKFVCTAVDELEL